MTRKARDLPNWYPLPVYRQSKSKLEWLHALVMRLTVNTVQSNSGDIDKAKKLFDKLVLEKQADDNQSAENLLREKQAGDLWGIRDPSVWDVYYLASMLTAGNRFPQIERRIEDIRQSRSLYPVHIEPDPSVADALTTDFGAAVSWDKEPFTPDDAVSGYPVVVDLDQDDESLVIAFKVWLAGVRDTLGAAPRPTEDDDLARWEELCLLEIWDLDKWAELYDLRYTNSFIANAIWPDDDVDVTERLRKVARPKIREIFSWHFVRRFWRQLELESALDRLSRETEHH